jgi:hypothetical protein
MHSDWINTHSDKNRGSSKINNIMRKRQAHDMTTKYSQKTGLTQQTQLKS